MLMNFIINIIKMSIIPKATYKFNAILTSISTEVYAEPQKIYQYLYETTKDLECPKTS